MAIWSNFFKKNNNWKETLIVDLIRISVMDGEIDEDEILVIFNTGIQLGISENRIQYIYKNIKDIKDIYPIDDNDKEIYTKSMYSIIMANNKIDKNQIMYFMAIMTKMKVDKKKIDYILLQLSNQQKEESNSMNTDLKLEDIVTKRNNLKEGIFANINNDLNDAMAELGYSIENTNYEEKLILMTNAYARRIVSAGLVLQGVFSIQDYQHSQKMFESMQLVTIHTKEFQELALHIAYQFISSYDERLTIETLQKILLPVAQNHSGNVETAKDLGIYYSYEDVLNSIPL